MFYCYLCVKALCYGCDCREKKYNKNKIDKQIKEFKPTKEFKSKKFAGKILWEEDPLAYQKRIRDEWD